MQGLVARIRSASQNRVTISLHWRLGVAAAVLALAGCGGAPRIGGNPNLAMATSGALPEPARADYAGVATPYFIGPNDKLVASVFGIEELSNRELVVDSGGTVSFPLVGAFSVNGMTPTEAEQELAGRLRRAHVRNPIVSINVKEVASRIVTVEGEVRMPGQYPVIGRLSLMGAIARAQGTTETSKLNDVVVFRTVGGKRYAALYDLNAIRHGVYEDPEIFPNDIVMVGESKGRRIFKDFLSILPALTSPLVILLNN